MNKLFYFLPAFLLLSFLSEAKSDWKAQWITTEHCQSATNTWLCYRKVVQLNEVPSSLIANVATDSKYWLWINDQLVVFEGGLKRGPSPEDTYYDEVEIAPYLKSGDNTIAVLVWHFGKSGFSHANTGRAALLFDCRAPGISILSDASWQCSLYGAYQNTEAPHPNYRLPESNICFDARMEIIDWNKTNLKNNLSGATPIARAEDAPFNKLVKRPIPLFKDFGLSAYQEIKKSPAGDTLYCRLPYNCHVTPYLKVKASEGKKIHMLTDNYAGGSSFNVRAEYITREGEQEYESLGWMNGHQMMYIIPEGVEVLDVKFRESGYNAEFTGSFECNDPFMNELWKRSARTLYVTMRDTYMDCPDRERAQWWGDEVNELGETFYALSPSAQKLALKGIYELMNWQRPNGTLFAPVPSVGWEKELPLQILASVGHYGFYTQYFYSGDSSFVPVIYDRLKVYLHQVWQTDVNGFPIERSGEWSWGDWGENIDMGVLTTCWYYLALQAEKEFAIQLNKPDDVKQITAMMQQIKQNFDTRYWTGSAYRAPGYKGETDDRSQAMAVLSGLAPQANYSMLKDVLRKEYHASPYMEKYVLEALFQMDDAAFALERMKDRYTPMMNYTEYTTLFEGWDVGTKGFGGGTINHAWSGGPLTMLSQYVCGVEPTSPGFKTFKIQPRLGTLTEAKATIDTVNGMIEASVSRSGKQLTLQVTVPEDTQAQIIFPSGKKKMLTSGTHTVKGR